MLLATPAPIPHQRADGAFDLVFDRTDRGTVLRHLHQAAPLRVLFPQPEPGEPPLAALLNCAGGLAGGDRLAQRLALGAGAMATLSTAAAEKVYRSLGPETRIATRIRLGPGAALEWLPQETILFDGARLERDMAVALDAGARLLASEILVFGRSAREETWRQGMLRDGWSVIGPAGPLWIDRQVLTPDDLAAPFGGGGAAAMGLLVFIDPAAAAARDLLRSAMADSLPESPCAALASPRAAFSLLRPGLLLGRWLGGATDVRAAVGRAIVALRGLNGLPARLPRLWST